MGSKKSSQQAAPPTDYNQLWGTYNKWQKEDAALAAQEDKTYEGSVKSLGKDRSRQEAMLGARGEKRGSANWEVLMGGIYKKEGELVTAREKMVAGRAKSAADLGKSSIATDLKAEYNRRVTGSAGYRAQAAKYAAHQARKPTHYLFGRPIYASGNRTPMGAAGFMGYRPVGPMNSGGYTGGISGLMNMNQNRAPRALPYKQVAAGTTFEEWGAQNFNAAADVEDPAAATSIGTDSPELATLKAQNAASGGRFGMYEEDDEGGSANPWI